MHVRSGARLQSLRMDAAALRRKRSEEQHDDIVASMRRHCIEGKQRKRSRRQVLRSSTAVTCPLRILYGGRMYSRPSGAANNPLEWNPNDEPRSGSVLSSATAGAPCRTRDISSSSIRITDAFLFHTAPPSPITRMWCCGSCDSPSW